VREATTFILAGSFRGTLAKDMLSLAEIAAGNERFTRDEASLSWISNT
jgi:hypothetical protein